PFFLFALKSQRFDVDRLFPAAVPGSSADPTDVSPDSVSMIILPDIDGRGTFTIDTLVYTGVEFSAIEGKVKIFDRKIDCYDVTGRVYSGGVSGRTTIDLGDFENPRYTGQFSGTQIEANDFVSRFTNFGGHIFGRANISGSYDAQGWDPDAFLNSLTLDGEGNVREGRMVTSGAFQELVDGLAKMTKQTLSNDQTLRELSTRLKVENGKVMLDRLTTTIDNVGDITIDGSYAFTGALDYSGTIKLTKENTEKLMSNGLMGNVASLLVGKKSQRIEIPLKISGTVDKPKAELDYSTLSKGMGENLNEQAGNLLEGLFKKK
ncbi:MAG: AsmA-like C-terminal region-containing protein, partial [candidate division Zixibacteria bacterium]|nr:AsmA-like C-terminal region-containing protein [candidate division Zixibacteria bacterium]